MLEFTADVLIIAATAAMTAAWLLLVYQRRTPEGARLLTLVLTTGLALYFLLRYVVHLSAAWIASCELFAILAMIAVVRLLGKATPRRDTFASVHDEHRRNVATKSGRYRS